MIDVKMVREIVLKYIYDCCFVIVGVGKEKFVLLFYMGIYVVILVV